MAIKMLSDVKMFILLCSSVSQKRFEKQELHEQMNAFFLSSVTP